MSEIGDMIEKIVLNNNLREYDMFIDDGLINENLYPPINPYSRINNIQIKNGEWNFIYQMALYFKNIDKKYIRHKNIKSEPRYICQKDILIKIIQHYEELKPRRAIGYVKRSCNQKNPCYEINFREVLLYKYCHEIDIKTLFKNKYCFELKERN